jgi:hypothetical protein
VNNVLDLVLHLCEQLLSAPMAWMRILLLLGPSWTFFSPTSTFLAVIYSSYSTFFAPRFS